MAEKKERQVLVVDAANLAYRTAYSGFPGMHKKFDETKTYSTGVVYGFFNSIFGLQSRYNFDCIALVFEGERDNNPRRQHPEYKNKRPTLKSLDVSTELIVIREFAMLLGMLCVVPEIGEADDGIANVADKLKDIAKVYVLSNDHDMNVLLCKSVVLLKPDKDEATNYITYTKKKFIDDFTFNPKHFSLFLAVAGDKSDCLIGVRGIGDKKAASVFHELEAEGAKINIRSVAECVFEKFFAKTAKKDAIGSMSVNKIEKIIKEYFEITKIRTNWKIDILYKTKDETKRIIKLLNLMEMNSFLSSIDAISNLASRLKSNHEFFISTINQKMRKLEPVEG